MSYHVITVESPTAELNCVHKQFICKTDAGTRSLPLDDIGAIIVCCFSAKIEMRLLTEAAKRGIGFVLCEAFKPACIVLPADRSTDTLLTRAWERGNAKLLKELWQKTLDAKCHNQSVLARAWEPDSPAAAAIEKQKFLRFRARESTVARLFWSVFRTHLGTKFMRLRGSDPTNALLDYGYSVLLARVLQFCFACGLDPTFGIGHATSERSTALAYDLMEPFRPLVDARVMTWAKKCAGTPPEPNKEFKLHLLPFLQERIEYAGTPQQAQTVMELCIRSFRKSLLSGDIEAYKPWMATNSKWAGCS